MEKTGDRADLKTYPWKERILIASGVLLGLLFSAHRFGPLSWSLRVAIGGFTAAFLFSPKGRSFWCFAGIAFGAIFSDLLSQ